MFELQAKVPADYKLGEITGSFVIATKDGSASAGVDISVRIISDLQLTFTVKVIFPNLHIMYVCS